MSAYEHIVFDDLWPDGTPLSGNVDVNTIDIFRNDTTTGNFTTLTATYTQFAYDRFDGPASSNTPALIEVTGYISDGAGGNYELQMFYSDSSNITSADFVETHVDSARVQSTIHNYFTAPITVTYVVCYSTGTTILTDSGQVAVERLSAGDTIVTASGAHRPIRWLGSRTIDCRSYPDPRTVWPVRVAAHAFGDHRPARDLFVSLDHALCVCVVDEVLIPASRLLNGSTIARHPVDSVTYWHVELDSHDILLANGLPAESYLDVGNRSFFAQSNTVDLHAAPGEGQDTRAEFCRPFVDGGPVLDLVRDRLAARAAQLGWREEHEADLHLMVDGNRVDGLRAADAAVFLVPASATDVRLVSDIFVPDDFNGWGDRRGLGVAILGLSLLGSDGEHRLVAVDDTRLGSGCFEPEAHDGRLRRWTGGDATFDHALWDGMAGPVALRLVIDQTNVRRCQAPAPATSEHVQGTPLRLVR